MPNHVVVVNDCAAPAFVGIKQVRTRKTEHGDATVQFEYGGLVAGLPRQLSDREQDFADILGAIFAIDQSCLRGDDADWNRVIDAWIPVRDPEYWTLLGEELCRCFGAFTYDRLRLTFVKDEKPPSPPRMSQQPHPTADGVALLSGGVDSFVGAAQLLNDQTRLLYLSHKNSPAASDALNAIIPTLAKRGGPNGSLSFTARRRNAPLGESSQRARSMVYMGLACLLAAVHEIAQVWINENGVMAVHLPLTEARIGSFSTRTASPSAVARFERFVTAALEVPLNISNVLVAKTKPEVAALGVALGLGNDLPRTVSCWSIGRTATHCGRCVPCLIRQVSHEWAGIGLNAYDDRPMDSLPSGAGRESARDNLAQMCALARDLDSLSEEDLLLEYPELLDTSPLLDAATSIQMHKRWAEQFLEVAGGHAESQRLL